LDNNLTTYLLTKNNEKTIEAALQSILWLNGKVIIGDMGSKDETVQIGRKHGAQVISFPFQDDYGRAKNQLLKSHKSLWQLYLEPWEQIITGHQAILEASQEQAPRAHYLQILRGQTITKEIRLWNKNLRFLNPVFETVNDDLATLLDPVVINSAGGKEENIDHLLELWKKTDPLSEEPHYYQAYRFLHNKDYQKFASLAEKYADVNKKGMSAVMIRYHLAMVNIYSLGDNNKAVRYLLECIAARPLMA